MSTIFIPGEQTLIKVLDWSKAVLYQHNQDGIDYDYLQAPILFSKLQKKYFVMNIKLFQFNNPVQNNLCSGISCNFTLIILISSKIYKVLQSCNFMQCPHLTWDALINFILMELLVKTGHVWTFPQYLWISVIWLTSIFDQSYCFNALLLFGLNFPQQSSLRNSLLNCLERTEHFSYWGKRKYVTIFAVQVFMPEIISDTAILNIENS